MDWTKLLLGVIASAMFFILAHLAEIKGRLDIITTVLIDIKREVRR